MAASLSNVTKVHVKQNCPMMLPNTNQRRPATLERRPLILPTTHIASKCDNAVGPAWQMPHAAAKRIAIQSMKMSNMSSQSASLVGKRLAMTPTRQRGGGVRFIYQHVLADRLIHRELEDRAKEATAMLRHGPTRHDTTISTNPIGYVATQATANGILFVA